VDAPRPARLSDAEAARRLRAAGLRATPIRLAVLAALRRLGGHRSANEVLGALGRRGGASRMSVYNAIAALERAALVVRADAGPGRALFEPAGAWHHHFVCARCGGVFDVPCLRRRKPCLAAPPAVGRAEEAQVIFRGVCRACERRAERQAGRRGRKGASAPRRRVPKREE
jgi:Fe2+ or Zn2+ uptake regulation protein